ncbi:BRO family protein [Lysinibacillus sp. 54212]|uniref:BRO family protein n=1 Tax=Lysinibacillus sp. 54212 TaxID=3119829 RepID=UPI002FC77E61
MNLALATQQQFNSVMCDFWQNENGDVFMTIDQLAQALEYADKNGVEQIVSRNEYLKDSEFSTTHKLSVVEGKRQVKRERRIFSEDGIYEVTMLSSQPKAKVFRAFVRKTLKALRKGETILVQPQTLDAELEIKKMRAEAMLNNSRTRQAKLILDMQKNKTLSPVAVELLNINALEVLTEKAIEHRPEVEKTYTATDIGEELGISAQKVGSIANKHNLKTSEYGYFALDKAKYSSKQVESFRYFEKGKKKIEEILNGAAS